ncbi:7-cyano-7-deazaguanine synthase, partial [Staphylococcus warneri]|uniref:7-cyano-7-deazaguanine synthase n=1 Tax=Staphylococcus warneri TaxID=1292 RepID=UPI001643BAE2
SGYPDSPDSFIKSINLTLNFSIHTDFLIHTPLISLDKPQTSQLAHHLRVLNYIPQNTLTSYNGIIRDPCGQSPPSQLTSPPLEKYLPKKRVQ